MKGEKGGARVRIRAREFEVEGQVHVGGRGPGHSRRLSDVSNEGTFVVLMDAIVRERPGDLGTEPEHYNTFILHKAEIVFAIPFD